MAQPPGARRATARGGMRPRAEQSGAVVRSGNTMNDSSTI